MLDYKFWYDAVQYGNENWKAFLTETEVEEQAKDFKEEFECAKKIGLVEGNLKTFIQNLKEDSENGNEDARIILERIEREMEICDMK